MSERTALLPGSFCWPELATPDSAAAKAFYSGLFGWTPVDVPSAGGTYTLLQLRGKDVAALRTLGREERERGVPPHWMSYVSTASADASAEKAKALGGSILAGPFDVERIGRMAVVRDPQGAVFALWEARGHIGARLVGEANTLCWTEIVTSDVPAAQAFYEGLFGWKAKPGTMEGAPPYLEIHREEQPIGGLVSAAERGGSPPHLMPYLFVDDCDATVEKATRLGGGAAVPAFDVPKVGRIAVLADPHGAMIAVISMAPPA